MISDPRRGARPRRTSTPTRVSLPPPPPTPNEQNARRPSDRRLLRRALSSPGAIRQAFVLREILGPPVALRTDTDDHPS